MTMRMFAHLMQGEGVGTLPVDVRVELAQPRAKGLSRTMFFKVVTTVHRLATRMYFCPLLTAACT